MSLTSALNNAFSGLRANTRAAEIIATNISNATTESYGRREVALEPGLNGTGGVHISGVTRHSDPVVMADRQNSDASLGYSDSMYAFAKGLENAVGESGAPGSLTGRVSSFENALLSAASNPASTQRLELVATTANDLANTLNALGAEVQDARATADRNISNQVDSLNSAMVRLDEINNKIIKASSTGGELASLLDERQKVLDSVSEIVPLRVVERERGDIAVFTAGGAALLDGRPYEVGFTQTNAIAAGTTLSGGGLSGLTLHGLALDSGPNGPFAGGSLAANFEIRDAEGVERQAELDGIARDLIERLDDSGPDGTLAAGDPGLFTDAGLAFVPANEVGIANRISLNNLVSPSGGGAWRLRDGLGAAGPGEVGDASLLQGVSAALSTSSVPSSSNLASVSRSFIDHSAEFASAASGSRVRAENQRSFASSQNIALKELEMSKGVDTDSELQRLMQVEQQYAASAKVMSTVDELMERLMAI